MHQIKKTECGRPVVALLSLFFSFFVFVWKNATLCLLITQPLSLALSLSKLTTIFCVCLFFLLLNLKQTCVCVCLNRDLKLENALLHREDSGVPRVKICDFGYSKSNLLHSNPKSTVGTPAYIAPEVLTPGNTQQYNGQIADVWSCGVLLYVMLVGSYPFEDPNDQRNLRKSIQRTLACKYSFPSHVSISEDCKHLLSRIFMLCDKRITIEEIRRHPWFLANLPQELQSEMLSRSDSAGDDSLNELGQSIEEVKAIIKVCIKQKEKK